MCGSGGRATAWLVQGPESSPSTTTKKKKKVSLKVVE
jgi:hypothetical protein